MKHAKLSQTVSACTAPRERPVASSTNLRHPPTGPTQARSHIVGRRSPPSGTGPGTAGHSGGWAGLPTAASRRRAARQHARLEEPTAKPTPSPAESGRRARPRPLAQSQAQDPLPQPAVGFRSCRPARKSPPRRLTGRNLKTRRLGPTACPTRCPATLLLHWVQMRMPA